MNKIELPKVSKIPPMPPVKPMKEDGINHYDIAFGLVRELGLMFHPVENKFYKFDSQTGNKGSVEFEAEIKHNILTKLLEINKPITSMNIYEVFELMKYIEIFTPKTYTPKPFEMEWPKII